MRVQASVRRGDIVFVAGMVGRDEAGDVVDGVEPQTRRTLERIEEALGEHGLDRGAIVRLRVYVTDIADWPAVRDEITAFLGEAWPPATAVAVAALVDPAMKVEIEVEAAA